MTASVDNSYVTRNKKSLGLRMGMVCDIYIIANCIMLKILTWEQHWLSTESSEEDNLGSRLS